MLGDLARTAMRFIETALRERRPWFRGQRSFEIYDTKAKLVNQLEQIIILLPLSLTFCIKKRQVVTTASWIAACE